MLQVSYFIGFKTGTYLVCSFDLKEYSSKICFLTRWLRGGCGRRHNQTHVHWLHSNLAASPHPQFGLLFLLLLKVVLSGWSLSWITASSILILHWKSPISFETCLLSTTVSAFLCSASRTLVPSGGLAYQPVKLLCWGA